MKKLLILSALAATGLTGIANAQTAPMAPPPPPPHGAPMPPRGMDQDANRDGVITRQEALDAAARRFDRMDANHDGRIDPAEREAMRPMHHRSMRDGDMPPPPPPPPPPAPPAPTPDGA